MKRHLTLLLSLVTLLAAARMADARFLIHQHASHCAEVGTGENTAFDRNEQRITRVKNIGTGRLLCPVTEVRDEADTKPRSSLKATVLVTDLHATGDVSCSLSIRWESGLLLHWVTQATTGTPGVAEINLELPQNWDRAMVLECTLPTNNSGASISINNPPLGKPPAPNFAAVHSYYVRM